MHQIVACIRHGKGAIYRFPSFVLVETTQQIFQDFVDTVHAEEIVDLCQKGCGVSYAPVFSATEESKLRQVIIMYAIIKLGGHQHRVEKDMVFLSELTGNESGSEFSTENVMIVGAGEQVKIGKPFVSGASVKLKVVEDIKGDKINGYVYKRRKGYQKSWGHRQRLQRLQVVDIKG